MTQNTHAASSSKIDELADETTSNNNLPSTIGMGVIALTTIAIFWNARALTPDFVDRANADGMTFGTIMLALTFALVTVMVLAGTSLVAVFRGRIIMPTLGATFSWLLLMWTMASLMPSDYDGRYNPYTRKLEPLKWQYESLAEAKSLPAVAGLIRLAARDGRINRGEAYDILHSETYYDAAHEDALEKNAALRRKVLKP